MNKHLRRRRNFSFGSLIVGLLLIYFKNSIIEILFGLDPLDVTFAMNAWFVSLVGIVLILIGVINLARLYFRGDI